VLPREDLITEAFPRTSTKTDSSPRPCYLRRYGLYLSNVRKAPRVRWPGTDLRGTVEASSGCRAVPAVDRGSKNPEAPITLADEEIPSIIAVSEFPGRRGER